MKKRQKAKKGITVDAIGQEHSLSVEAKNVLQKLACDFLEGCFNRESFIPQVREGGTDN